MLLSLYPALDQQISILHVGGKTAFAAWTELFEDFGLAVYRIGDLDYCYNLFYPKEKGSNVKLTTPTTVAAFKSSHADHLTLIEQEYEKKTYIFASGDLEHYLRIGKDLSQVIHFCTWRLDAFLNSTSNAEVAEVRKIIRAIAS